jgi:nondiscriminating glutamyl-tRNA synthetase
MAKTSVLEPETKKILIRQEEQQKIKTRFAPSPTGLFHIGNARTALFAYLFARSKGGSFILRIEDTDRERSTKEFEKNIIEGLKWLGLDWDEGPDIGGPYGPYRQMERLDIYEKYLKKLLDENLAYYCFCSEDELEAERQYRLSQGQTPKYSGKCRNLSKEEVEKNIQSGKPYIIRFKTPAKKVVVNDIIKGKIEFDTELIGDFTIAKDLKSPLFLLSSAVDDIEMKITHVIRGEDHLSNTPKQMLILEALGLPGLKYGHLPMILGPDKSKLSKRHGATSVIEYKNDGYLPDALINFMALLGWNPGTEKEIFSLNSLIKEFSIDRVQKGGAIFNLKRLDWINGFYIRIMNLEKLTQLCIPYFINAGFLEIQDGDDKFLLGHPSYKVIETEEIFGFNFLEKIILLYQERLKKLSEISELCGFFFKDKLDYESDLLLWPRIKTEADESAKKEIVKGTKESLEKVEKILSKIKDGDWTKENLENILMAEAESWGDRGKILWPLRAALTGLVASASPIDIATLLGKEKSLKRIKEGINKF